VLNLINNSLLNYAVTNSNYLNQWSQTGGLPGHFVRSAMRLGNFIEATLKLFSLFTCV